MQLRNLINRRNVKRDISGKFNEAIDFFELVVTGYVIAAALHFFGMRSVTDKPARNCPQIPKKEQHKWSCLQSSVAKIVDQYVVIHELSYSELGPITSDISDPRAVQIATEHSYAHTQPLMSNPVDTSNPHATRIASEHCYLKQPPKPPGKEKKTRKLPPWLCSLAESPLISNYVKQKAPDGVFNYSSALLNDGLLLLELRDSIRRGDGPRDLRCWKFMLLYWRYAGHTKYSLEVIHLIGAIKATATPRLAHEITWCRFVSSRGGSGNNIPVDLYMEHLNRTLKDCLLGLGANISESTIIQISRSLSKLMAVSTHFDSECGVPKESIYHTCKDTSKDLQLVVDELQKSKVFDYIPGRYHKTFQNIKPHISAHVDTDKLFSWIQGHQKKISNSIKLRNILHKI